MGNREQIRTCASATELIALPYAKRQMLVVADDALIEAVRVMQKADRLELKRKARAEVEKQEARKKQAEEKGKDGDDSLWEGIKRRIPRLNFGLGASSSRVVQELSDLIDKDDELDILTIGYSTAAALRFPPGHPRQETIYVGHPTLHDTYYTAANFHRLTFEHKFAEAVRLLMALGATQISVERVSGWSHEFAAQLHAVPNVIAGKGGSSRTSGSRILFEARLDGTAEPTLPDGMVWYAYEPTWQAIAGGRLKYGIQSFNLSIEYTDDYNVNAKLKVGASEMGLDLGGKFTEFQETVWRMEGHFTEVSPEQLAKPRAEQ